MKPRLHELHYDLGYVLQQQSDLAGAAHHYRQALDLKTNYAEAHHNLAIVLDQQGQSTAAIEQYQVAIDLQPDCIEAYNNLGCALLKLGKTEAAAQVLQHAIKLQPTWAVLQNHLGLALAQSDPSAAINAYRRAIDLHPDFTLAHYNLGLTLQNQGQYQAAIDCFQKVLQSEPNHPRIHGHLSAGWIALGQWQEVLQSFYRAIAQQPDWISRYCDWSQQLEHDDELNSARITCGQLLTELQQQHFTAAIDRLAQLYQQLGNISLQYGSKQQYQQAETYYQYALQLKPDRSDLYLQLGNSLLSQGRSNATLFVAQLASTLSPTDYRIQLQRGIALEQNQQWETAIDCYRQALAQQKQNRQPQYHKQDFVKLAETQNRPQKIYTSTQDWIKITGTGQYNSLNLTEVESENTEHHLLTTSPQQSHPEQWSEAPPCEGLNCSTCLKQMWRQIEPVHLGEGIYTIHSGEQADLTSGCQNSSTSPLQTQVLPLSIAKIPQGKAWIAPQQNAWQVCHAIAILTSDNDLLAEYSRDYPGQLPGCTHDHTPTHRIFTESSLPPVELIEGRVAVLSGLSGHNYFHWMIDVLPRLYLIQQSNINLSEIDWFLVNSTEQKFQQETLRHLGIPETKVLASDRHPHIQANQLIVPSFPSYLGWLEPWSLQFLREQFLPLKNQMNRVSSDRIYITRQRAQYRRVLNEPEVLDLLLPLGFRVVELETLDLAEQIALFANAQIIVAAHGGGLTNTLFCQPKTTIIELTSPHYIRHYYWRTSFFLNLKHFCLIGESSACSTLQRLMYPSPLMEDIWVNLNALQRVLAEAARELTPK